MPVTPDCRYAVLVDVGYLYASAAATLLQASSRRDYKVDTAHLIADLKERIADTLGQSLLRVYWYDASRDRVPTVEHRVVASLPHVKLRLGNLNRQGQQKGVDALIRGDLETLAHNRAVSHIVLVAGDEDMIPGVEAAQGHGVVVHLWGVEPEYGSNQAERLIWECDDSDRLPQDLLKPHFTRVDRHTDNERTDHAPTPLDVITGSAGGAAPAPRLSTGGTATRKNAYFGPPRERMTEVGEHVAQKWILTRGKDNLRDLLPGPMLPTVIDHELLVEAEKELDCSLRPYQEARTWLRDGFWERIYREFGIRT